ncbi:hypothetical protein Tco_1219341 [Tanacetum coccineum]
MGIDLVTEIINKFIPHPKTTNLREKRNPEISRQKFDETFCEAWDRFNDLLRGCPHHGFSELHQLDTFYNALNSIDQDSLNSAAGGNFLDKMPRECLKKNIESMSKEDLKGITTRSGVTIQGPKAVSHDTEVTKDTMPPANNGSTEDVQPPVVQIQSRNPNPEPNIPLSQVKFSGGINTKDAIDVDGGLADLGASLNPYCRFSDYGSTRNLSPCLIPIVANSSPTLTPLEKGLSTVREANAFLALDEIKLHRN